MMLSEANLKTIKEYVSEENVHLGEPLAPLTTFRVGGPATCLVEPENEEQLMKLCKFLKLVELPFFVLGNGSNILVKDSGYDGIVLHIGGKMNQISVEGNRIIAGAGANLVQVSRLAQQNGLTGLEFAAGIPGSVGGGVVMNAGAYGGEMSQVVASVKVVSLEGEELHFSGEQMEFGYRESVIRKYPSIVTEVVFELQPGDPEQIKATMEEYNRRRREKQPLEYPSAGSTFKRPEGYFAGQLIMDAGLRGYQVGGARVSDKHCGFVINTGNATAEDVLDVIADVRDRVRERFGILLETEVVVLG